MAKIKILKAEEIIDSRGNPTLEVICILESNAEGRFGVPSGKSTGVHEIGRASCRERVCLYV